MTLIYLAGAAKTPVATAAETGDKATPAFLQPSGISSSTSPPLPLYVHAPRRVCKCPRYDFDLRAESEQGISEEHFLTVVR